MRSRVRSIAIAIAAGILTLGGIQDADAQITDSIEFATTFPFTVGTTTLPAGAYTIRPDDDNGAILQLSWRHGSVFFEANDAQSGRPVAKTEVVFKRYGDVYILKSLWQAGSDRGVETLAQEGERHVAKKGGTVVEVRISARKVSIREATR